MEDLVRSIQLENGLKLDIYDASRKIAADRYQVALVARMPVLLKNLFEESTANPPLPSEIKQVLGETVTYEIKKERNFIDAREKTAVFSQLLENFVTLSVPYLARPEFPRRFVLRRYHEQKNQIFR